MAKTTRQDIVNKFLIGMTIFLAIYAAALTVGLYAVWQGSLANDANNSKFMMDVYQNHSGTDHHSSH